MKRERQLGTTGVRPKVKHKTVGENIIVRHASLTTSRFTIGKRSITAVYNVDSNFTGSTSNRLSQVVTKATQSVFLRLKSSKEDLCTLDI
jgi:hypothetical protein